MGCRPRAEDVGAGLRHAKIRRVYSVAKTPIETPADPVGPIDTPATASRPGVWIIQRLAASFAHPNFRNLWLAAFTSAVGTWMQRFAQQWLILTLTGSAFFLGLDAFLGELPLLLFTLIGGVIADRHDRRHLLIASQSLQMVSALTLTAIVYFDVAQVHHILALSFVTGLAQAFGGPAFQSMIPSLVPRSKLPNAIALNSIQFNLAQMVGPLIGGVVLVAYGLATCFGINGLSFLVVIVVLSLMRLPPPPTDTRQRIMVELKGGLSYVRNNGALVSLTILAMATTSLGLPIRAFLPVFADDAAHLSRMMTVIGGGAVVGALTIAWLGQFQHMGRTLLIVQIAFAALVVTFAVLPISAVTYVVLFSIGATLLMIFSLTNSLVQLTVPNELRGRVMSIYLVAFRGGMPLGSLVSGYFISRSSAPLVVAVNGVLLALVAIYFLVRNHGVKEL
jgi:MFS family permease